MQIVKTCLLLEIRKKYLDMSSAENVPTVLSIKGQYIWYDLAGRPKSILVTRHKVICHTTLLLFSG